MIIIVGLVILVAALVAGLAGVLGNDGSAHAVSHFSVLGYHLTGSAGTLFLAGIVVGAAGLLGLSLLLAGLRRRRRRGSAATRRLRQSRRETAAVSRERDDLIEQRDTARANTTSNLGNSIAPQGAQPGESNARWSRLRDLRRRLAPARTAAQSDASVGRPVSEVPASGSDASAMAMSPATSDVTSGASDPDRAGTSSGPDTHATASAPAQ
jgi:hypothetical protein